MGRKKGEDQMPKPDVWRPVPGYEHYEASFDGQIRSTWFDKPRIMAQHRKRGRGEIYFVCLRKHGKTHKLTAARIVYAAFYGEIPEGYDVVHKNRVGWDNCIANLELLESGERAKATVKNARRKPVCKIGLDGTILEVYPSGHAAAEANHFTGTTITDRCNGHRKEIADDGCDYAWDDDEDSIAQAQARLAKWREKNELPVRAKREEDMW